MRWRGGLRVGVLAVAACLVATVAPAASPKSLDWRQVATVRDRDRLRNWRSAWIAGLAAARAGDGAATIAADPALFDPDLAATGALPPAGAYRCRAFKLGAIGAADGFTAYPAGTCRIDAEGPLLRLSRVDGPQRPTGLIFADTDVRAIFLGTMVFSDETRALPYGRDTDRDIAALIERIGHARWRVVLPYPRYGSTVDVVELVPAVSG